MFSEYYTRFSEDVYNALHLADEKISKKPLDEMLLEDLVHKSKIQDLSLVELALISRATSLIDPLEEQLRNTFRSGTGEVRYIAPTFQTNNCIDVCVECGWNRDADAERISLKAKQFSWQLDALKNNGFGVIEISNATNAKMLEWDSFKHFLAAVKPHIDPAKGEGFGICSALFDDMTMQRIFPDFAQFWVQWMETYDMPSYFRVHRFSDRIPAKMQKYSKAMFSGRLDSYDKVMALGADVMLGVQYGLNLTDSAFDALMTVVHGRYLEKEYGRAPLVFGTVTNNSYGDKEHKYADGLRNAFSEEEYRTLLAVTKTGMPQVGRWLSTRVPFSLIKGAILDGDCYTGECSDMVPGKREGITFHSNAKAGQFRVYENPKATWESNLAQLGLSVNYRWMNRQGQSSTIAAPAPVLSERAHEFA